MTTTQRDPARTTKRLRLFSDLSALALPALILIMAVVVGLIEPLFWSSANIANLLRQLAPLLIICAGQAFTIISGGLDLSVAAILAAAGVVGVLVMGEYGVVAGILAMLATGLAVGLLNGFLITRFRITPFITTLGTLSVVQGITLVISNGLPLYDVPDSFLTIFGDQTVVGIPMGAIISFGCVLLAGGLLSRTVFGRYVYAVGASPAAAHASGVPVSRVILGVYGLSGLMAGIAAVVMTAWVSAAQPLAGSGLELQSIAAAVIGGTALAGGVGRMTGVVCGALILGMLSNGLNMIGVSSFYQTSSIGLIIIVAVILDKFRRTS